MRVFKNKPFMRFARKVDLNDAALCEAIANAERGLIDADLGGGVIKQRVPRPGKGKSGGFRTMILYKRGKRAFFVYGFAKSERSNVSEMRSQRSKSSRRNCWRMTMGQSPARSHLEHWIEVKCYEEGQGIKSRKIP